MKNEEKSPCIGDQKKTTYSQNHKHEMQGIHYFEFAK